MKYAIRAATATSIDEKNHTVRVRMTDESVDTYGTILHHDGWDLSAFMDNPVVQLDHYGDGASNIGRVLEIIPVPEERALDAIVQFDVEDESEYGGKWAWGKVSRGFLRTWSVGFDNLIADGMDYLQNKLFELSLVAIPSNSNATVRALKDGQLDTKEAQWLLKRYKSEAKSLQTYLNRDNNNNKSEEATNMNKEEMQAAIAEAVAPFKEALDKLPETVNAAVTTATKDLTEQVSQLAKGNADDEAAAKAAADAKAKADADAKAAQDAAGHNADDEEISDDEAEKILAEYEADLDKEFKDNETDKE
jgi:predicted RNA-binding Zn ribbon-like protein